MNRVSASPVLQEARAMGRAFRGAGRALRRFETWFLLLALGVAAPWVSILLVDRVVPLADQGMGSDLRVLALVAIRIAVDMGLIVLLMALLVPVLDGNRRIELERLRRPAMRLIGAAAALAGAEIVWEFAIVIGWNRWLGYVFSWSGPGLIEFCIAVVEAWVLASVIAAMRDRRAWNWSARHLLTGGTALFMGSVAMTATLVPLQDHGVDIENWLTDFGLGRIPPPWWVLWKLGDMLFVLVALEYLRAVPAEAPEVAAP